MRANVLKRSGWNVARPVDRLPILIDSQDAFLETLVDVATS